MFWRYGGSFFGTMTDTNKWARMYQNDGEFFTCRLVIDIKERSGEEKERDD